MNEEDFLFKNDLIDDKLIDANGNFDIVFFLESLKSQMSNYSERYPKTDLISLFISRGLKCTLEDIENGDFETNISDEFEESFDTILKELNDCFMSFYGIDTGSADLSSLHKLYRVLVLNLTDTFAHYIACLGTKYNELDDPDRYTIIGSATPQPVDSMTGESIDISKSLENVEITKKIESIDDSIKNLILRSCSMLSGINLFKYSSLKDVGNVDLNFVYDKFESGEYISQDNDFFIERISNEINVPENFNNMKRIYLSILS